MPELSIDQYSLVYNMFSLTIAAMFGTFAFFVLAKENVAQQYRPAIICSSLVVLIAGYHYFRIFQSWSEAYHLAGGVYAPSGEPFNDAYRYVDWLLTVPLLLVELVTVLALTKEKSRDLLMRLVVAAVLMIGLGYPGEVATSGGTAMIFFIASCIPFAYILYTLWGELQKEIESETDEVKSLVSKTRMVLVITWMFYPLAYLFNLAGSSADGEVAVQFGYTIADIAAKCGYGIMVYMIAVAKTQQEGGVVKTSGKAAAAKA